MKRPKKPYEPQKPVAPQKKNKLSQRIYMSDLLPLGKYAHASKSVKLSEVLTKLPAGIALDDIYLCEESSYDYYSGDGGPYHYLEYTLEVDNIYYDR